MADVYREMRKITKFKPYTQPQEDYQMAAQPVAEYKSSKE